MTRTTYTPASTPADRRPVEDLLREIAYVLHVTRKVHPREAWPVLADEDGNFRTTSSEQVCG